MKNILFILIITVLLGSCTTWHENWSRQNGWIDPVTAAEIRAENEKVPERLELPQPIISELELEIIDVIDKVIVAIENGTYNFSELEGKLMEGYIAQDGTVEKYQLLAEIYEKHYLNKDGKIHAGRTLDEMIAEYYSLLNEIEKAQIKNPEVDNG